MTKTSYKTISANSKTVNKEWVLVDAAELPLGRTASIVATLLEESIRLTLHRMLIVVIMLLLLMLIRLNSQVINGAKSNILVIQDILGDKELYLLKSFIKKTILSLLRKLSKVCFQRISLVLNYTET